MRKALTIFIDYEIDYVSNEFHLYEISIYNFYIFDTDNESPIYSNKNIEKWYKVTSEEYTTDHFVVEAKCLIEENWKNKIQYGDIINLPGGSYGCICQRYIYDGTKWIEFSGETLPYIFDNTDHVIWNNYYTIDIVYDEDDDIEYLGRLKKNYDNIIHFDTPLEYEDESIEYNGYDNTKQYAFSISPYTIVVIELAYIIFNSILIVGNNNIINMALKHDLKGCLLNSTNGVNTYLIQNKFDYIDYQNHMNEICKSALEIVETVLPTDLAKTVINYALFK